MKRSKHSGVIGAFREHFVKSGDFALDHSDAFGDASEARELADYDMAGQVDEQHAEKLLDDAHRFVEDAAHYLRKWGYP